MASPDVLDNCLSEVKIKKNSLEIFLCLFYENPLFSFGLFIVFFFMPIQHDICFVYYKDFCNY